MSDQTKLLEEDIRGLDRLELPMARQDQVECASVGNNLAQTAGGGPCCCPVADRGLDRLETTSRPPGARSSFPRAV